MKASILLLTSLSFVAVACTPDTTTPTASTESLVALTKTAVKTSTSPHSFPDTVARIEAAIDKRPLNLFTKIDHAAGAAKAGLKLAPSTLFIFGNPKGGTPLMSRNPQMGIVLPLKMHVFQDGETVKISYTDIAAAAESHGLDSSKLPIPNIIKMLDVLAAEITAN